MNGSEQYYNVRMSSELVRELFLRDHECNRLSVQLGKPDADGFYTPVVTVDYTDNPLAAAEQRANDYENALRDIADSSPNWAMADAVAENERWMRNCARAALASPPEQPMCGASPIPWILLAAMALAALIAGGLLLARCAG